MNELSPSDYEFFIGRHLPRMKKFSPDELEKKQQKQQQDQLIKEQQKFDAKKTQWAHCAHKFDVKPKTALKQIHQKNDMTHRNDEHLSNATTKLSSQILPSEITLQERSFYMKGGRTWHQEIQPSKERLERYKYRKLISNVEKFSICTQKKGSTMTTFPSSYPKNEFQYSYKDQMTKQEKEQIEAIQKKPVYEPDGDNPAVSEDKIFFNDTGSNQNYTLDGKKKRNISLEPRKKAFLGDHKRDQSFSTTNQFEISSQFNNYKPGNSLAEIQLENMWFQNRNREAQQIRENEEMITHMMQWSITKSRLEKEIHRRIDSKIQGSKYGENFDISPPKQRQQDLIELMADAKQQIQIQEIQDENQVDSDDSKQEQTPLVTFALNVKNSGRATPLDIQTPGAESNSNPNTTQRGRRSFSLIQKPRFIDFSVNFMNTSREDKPGLYTSTKKVQNLLTMNKDILNISNTTNNEYSYRPLSLSVYGTKADVLPQDDLSLISQLKVQKLYNEQLGEAKEIKERLAKHKIAVPIKSLLNSLVTPTWHRRSYNSDNNAHVDLDNDLPEPGYGLAQNPFEVLNSKKTKKIK